MTRSAAAPSLRQDKRTIIGALPGTLPGILSRDELRKLVAQMID